MSDYTHHHNLCRAGVWMLRRRIRLVANAPIQPAGCFVAASELRLGHRAPDVIGWSRHGTHLVECKTSRRDFFKDAAKAFRSADFDPIGRWRWYLTAPGVTRESDNLGGWGVVVFDGRRFEVLRYSQDFRGRGMCSEDLLLAMLCRMYCTKSKTGGGILPLQQYYASVEPWRVRPRIRQSKGAAQ